MPTVLEVKNLSVVFDKKPVLENINFSLGASDNLSIIGPNGAGKTMLLKALLGEVDYQGTIAWAPDTSIGYVPQKIDADRHLPVTFTDLFKAKCSGLTLPAKEIEGVVSAVGLSNELMQTPVGHLSGGQFQRGLIGFALLGKPNVLLFDEPTASIDKKGEEAMYELIHRLQDEYKLTIILVSHDLSFVYRYATKVLCLNKENICFGDPQEVLTAQVLEKLYGTPLRYYHHIHEEHVH